MRSITLLGHAYLATHWPAKDSGNHQDCNEFSIGAAITTVLSHPPDPGLDVVLMRRACCALMCAPGFDVGRHIF